MFALQNQENKALVPNAETGSSAMSNHVMIKTSSITTAVTQNVKLRNIISAVSTTQH